MNYTMNIEMVNANIDSGVMSKEMASMKKVTACKASDRG